MKKTVIYLYATLMVLTLIAFIILTFFKGFNLLMCELALGTSLLFALNIVKSKLDDVFKISLLIGGTLVTLINYVLSLFIPEHFDNNILLFIFLLLITIQLIAIIGLRYITKFA